MNTFNLRTVITAALLSIALPASAANPGQAAPNCALQPLNGKGSILPDGYGQGHVTYVDFWASWCGPCRDSFPFLNQMHKEFGGRGLQVVGVNMDENRPDAVAFLEQTPADFPIAATDGGQCGEAFGVEAMPSSYLIDKHGVIRYIHKGFRNSDRAELRQHIEALLAE